MAKGALAQTDADIAVAITGIAGPMAVRKTNPSALVYLALAQTNHDAMVKRYVFAGHAHGYQTCHGRRRARAPPWTSHFD